MIAAIGCGMIYGKNYWNGIDIAIKKLIPELKLIYKIFGDSDIEWVYGIDEELSIVQRRPITAKFCINKSTKNSNGTCIVPGKVKGKLMRYEDYNGEQGVIVYAKSINPKEFFNIISCAGLLTVENTLLSHTAILAREIQIPYYCGISKGMIEKYIDCQIEIDFQTGSIICNVSDEDIGDITKGGDSEIEYNILDEIWAQSYFINKLHRGKS